MARRITDVPPQELGRRLLWFAALYIGGVAVVFAVAGLLKAVLPH